MLDGKSFIKCYGHGLYRDLENLAKEFVYFSSFVQCSKVKKIDFKTVSRF